MKILLKALTLLTIPLVSIGMGQTEPPIPAPTKTQIIDRAKQLTGLNALFEVDSIENDPTALPGIPFLSQELKGNNFIKVTYKTGALKLKTAPPGSVDKYQRKFVVILDATAEHLLSVISSGPNDSPDIHREPLEKAEAMLRSCGELYESLPTSDPEVTFLNALEIIQKHGVGAPLLSQEIEGFYVIQSQYDLEMKRPKSAKWMISLRGGPPIPMMPSSLPNWARSRIRERVDATSGKWLGATSFP
jgi:hypothetical protein